MVKESSSNPAEQYHKEQRKKSLKKNKIHRIKQRDERVAATESATSIKKEIDALERKREKREGYLDNVDVRKLERYKKELKIVQQKASEESSKEQAASACNTSNNDATGIGIEQQIIHKYGEFHPTTSYYYHATLNPYGVPPPGKPMIWHSKFGGTTMDVRMAGFLLPENQQQQQQQQKIPTPSASISNTNSERIHTSTKPPPPPPPIANHQQPRHNQQQKPCRKSFDNKNSNSNNACANSISNIANQPIAVEPAKKRVRLEGSSLVPTLPEPSLAVRRGKKSRSLQADIWASTEELEFDGSLTVNGEETSSQQQHRPAKRSTKNNNNKDYDKDDPCCPAGENYSEYRGDITSKTTFQKKKTQTNDNISVDRWYYQDSSSTIQGPFTGEQMMQWNDAGYFPPQTPTRNGEIGLFSSLSSINFLSSSNINNEKLSQLSHTSSNDDVEARIAALREQTLKQHQEEEEEEEESKHMQQNLAQAQEEVKGNGHEELPQYEEQHQQNESLCDIEISQHEDDNDAYCCYPVPDTTDATTTSNELMIDDAEYPTDISYPVDISYPISYDDGAMDDDQVQDEDIPVYPVHLATANTATETHVVTAPKARYQGDTDILAFMPSHLQVKRSRPPSDGFKKKTISNKSNNATGVKVVLQSTIDSTSMLDHYQPQQKSSLTDVYDNFMDEINRLQ